MKFNLYDLLKKHTNYIIVLFSFIILISMFGNYFYFEDGKTYMYYYTGIQSIIDEGSIVFPNVFSYILVFIGLIINIFRYKRINQIIMSGISTLIYLVALLIFSIFPASIYIPDKMFYEFVFFGELTITLVVFNLLISGVTFYKSTK